MVAYIIARIDITDPEGAKTAYPKYVEAAAPSYGKHGGRFLVRGGAAHPLEGEARARNVVIAFPDRAAALAHYGSDTYQGARHYRLPVSIGELVVVDGIAEPSPAGDAKRGFWIARFDVRDAEAYQPYVETAKPAFERHGARFLARGGQHQALEGQARTRNVLIEFPSLEDALACWRSDEYQRAREHRLPVVSTGEIVAVEGA